MLRPFHVPGFGSNGWLGFRRRDNRSPSSAVRKAFHRPRSIFGGSVCRLGRLSGRSRPPVSVRCGVVAAAEVAVHLPGGTRFSVPTGDAQSLRLVIETVACVDAAIAGGDRPC